MPGKRGRFRTKRVPRTAHPLIQRVFERANELKLNYDAIAEASGVDEKTIMRWKQNVEPGVGSLEAVLNALGMELVAVPAEQVQTR
jgi:transcriptional regulator with XRE-family HTH domain